jgi:hypothetical protein
MRNVKMLRTEPNLLSIPVERAIYCKGCEMVSNSTRQRCGVCGSDAIVKLKALIDGPPGGPDPGPDSGPAPAGCLVPALLYQQPRAA